MDKSDEPVQTHEVPQADSLDVLRCALMAVNQGHRYKPEIADYLMSETETDWTFRQADYYLKAADTLGYAHEQTTGDFQGEEMRQWGLTEEGSYYIELIGDGQDDEAHQHLIEQIRNIEIFRRVLDCLKSEGSFNHKKLKKIIQEESEVTGETVGRRVSTIGTWLTELPEVRRSHKGNTYKYTYIDKTLSDF